jgi:galactose-1-phosphate uridylyltransferase
VKVSIFRVRLPPVVAGRRRPVPDLDDVLAVHEAPVGEHPYYPIHLEMRRPLRPLGLRRYPSGPEVGGGSMTNESDPDQKAEEFRAARA